MNENNTSEVQAPVPAKLPDIRAGGQAMAIVAGSFEDAWRIAQVAVKSGMAPSDYNSTEKAMVAIMHGAEVGLSPMQALQSIAMINGRPTIWGDAAIGLVRSHRHCKYVRETFNDETMTATCEVKRGDEIVMRSFSKADAETAHLWNKKGRNGGDTPWVTYPKRMLQMRARSWALRDSFADVLKGLSIREEVEDFDTIDVTPKAAAITPPAPPEDNAPDEEAPASAEPQAEPPTPPEALDPAEFLATVEKNLVAVSDPEVIENYWNEFVEPRISGLDPSAQEELRGAYNKRMKELEP